MNELLAISAGIILSMLIMGSVLATAGLIILFFTFALRKPPERKQVTLTMTDAVQEGINEVDIDFEIKHPRAMFVCPYDSKSCAHVDTSTMTTDIKCDDCPRYTGIKPPKF